MTKPHLQVHNLIVISPAVRLTQLRDKPEPADEDRRRSSGPAFLRLEASGWKRRRPGGLAFRRRPATTRFFEAVCSRYMRDGRMWFLSLEGRGAPLAMICCVRAGEGVFAYRTAYDEALAKFGPGVSVATAAASIHGPRPGSRGEFFYLLRSHERPGIGPVVVTGRGKPGAFGAARRPCAGAPRIRRSCSSAATGSGTASTTVSQPESTSAGNSSPAKSHITVRSFASTWKHRPWSIPQIRLSRSMMRWPPLRSPLFARRSKAAIRRSWA